MKNFNNDFLSNLKLKIENKDLIYDRFVLQNYALQISVVDYDRPLVFTFDNMNLTSTLGIEERSGWGHDFLVGLGYNVCSFLESDVYRWYRHEEFYQLIEAIRAQGVFESFPKTVTYGSSMGGYAASAYANALNADVAILMNPISSLNPQAAPFETRFSRPKRADWKGPYCDGVEGVKGVSSYIIYDPLFYLDSQHAKRYLNSHSNITEIRLFGFGHGVPWYLKALNVLKPLVVSLLKDEFSHYRKTYYKELRKRRFSKHYYHFMLSNENTHLTVSRAKVIHKAIVLELSKRYTEDADFFRELFNIYSGLDDELAFMFISRAKKARPTGQVINRMYENLKIKVSQN